MKNLLSVLTAMSLSFSQFAFATVAENKAKKASETKIAEATSGIKDSCGNKTLDVKIDWKTFDGIPEKVEAYTKDRMLEFTGERATHLIELFKSACADADYKAEIAKVTVIKMVPMTKDLPKTNGDLKFVRSGNVITVNFHPYASSSGTDAKAIHKLF